MDKHQMKELASDAEKVAALTDKEFSQLAFAMCDMDDPIPEDAFRILLKEALKRSIDNG